MYKLAGKFQAKLRPDSTDGIMYDNDNLKLKLDFQDNRDCEDFQSVVREIPLHYRKLGRDFSDITLTITDSVTEADVLKS